MYFGGHPYQNLVVLPTNQADYIFEGSELNAQLGYDILGDVNIDNDGIGDLVLSSLTTNQWGEPVAQSHVIRMGGLPTGTYDVSDVSQVIQSHPLSWMLHYKGVHLANLGDVNSDGRDDIAMGFKRSKHPTTTQAASTSRNQATF